MRKSKKLVVLMCGVMMLGLSGVLMAESEIINIMSNLKAGPVEIHPRIDVGFNFDNNIYLSSADAKSSAIITVNPGVGLTLPLGEHKITAGYNLNVLSYTEKPDINSALHQTAGLGAAFNFAMGLRAGVNYAYTDTTDPQSSELTQRVKRNQNLVLVNANYNTGNKLAFDFVANWTAHQYKESVYNGISTNLSGLNRSETYIAPTVLFQILPKTSLLAEVGYGMTVYSSTNSKDSSDIKVSLGVKGAVAPKTNATIKVGMQSRTYPNSIADNPQPTITTQINTGTQVTEKTTLSLGIVKSLLESSYSSNKYYDSTDLSVGVGQGIGKLSLDASLGFNMNAYPLEETMSNGDKLKRADNTVRVGFGVSYVPQPWLNSGLKLEYKSRSSNIANYQYNDLIVKIDAGVRF